MKPKTVIGNNRKCSNNLVVTYKELALQNKEKKKRALELLIIQMELKRTNALAKEYALGLEKIICMISHEVRQPIAHILGLSNMIEKTIKSPHKLKRKINYIKQSALTLDTATKKLTLLICNLRAKKKSQIEIFIDDAFFSIEN
jgi:signal transduction histidine kinase